MLNETKLKLCPYSKSYFKAKRENQIYATAEDRIAYNNQQNNLLRRKLSFINKQLLKNYKIADSLLSDFYDVSVHKEHLKGRGFSFRMFTHVSQKDNEIVYGLYDICFTKLEDGYYYLYRAKC
jgi:hypothetical protein